MEQRGSSVPVRVLCLGQVAATRLLVTMARAAIDRAWERDSEVCPLRTRRGSIRRSTKLVEQYTGTTLGFSMGTSEFN